MRAFMSLALGGVAAPASLAADLTFNKPEDAIKYRQAAFVVMGQHLTRIGTMVRGRAPYDPRAAVESAEIVATVARLPWAGFAASTEKHSTGVKPEAWTEVARFKDQNDKLLSETGKLLTAARSQNLDNLKAAFSSTAATCKSCHDAYRTN
jgi:cytochrome c556